jgi:hypothetical protein
VGSVALILILMYLGGCLWAARWAGRAAYHNCQRWNHDHNSQVTNGDLILTIFIACVGFCFAPALWVFVPVRWLALKFWSNRRVERLLDRLFGRYEP